MSNRKTLLPFIMFGLVFGLVIQLADNRYIPYTPYYPIHPYHEGGGGHLSGPNGQPVHSMMPYDHYQPIWTPHGTFFDQQRKVLRVFPGGGVPVIVDYEKRCSDGFIGVKKHPDHPQYYYACKSDCVIFGKCQDYQFFDANKGQCVPYPLPRFAPVCSQPGHFPVYSNCTLYYTCDCSLQSEIFSCPPGTIFSSAQGECINGRQCPPTEIAQGSYIPENCEQKYPPCLENGTFRSPMDCSLYYKCGKQTNGVFLQTRFKCPGDTLFHTEQELCLPPQQVPCDRIQIAHLVYPAQSQKSYPPNYYPYVADSEEVNDFTVSQPKPISCLNSTSDEDAASLEPGDLIITTTKNPTTIQRQAAISPTTITDPTKPGQSEKNSTTIKNTDTIRTSAKRASLDLAEDPTSPNTIKPETSSTAIDFSSNSINTTEQIATTNSGIPTEQTATSHSASTIEQTATTDSASTTGNIATTDSTSTIGQTATTIFASTTGQTATTDSASTAGQTATTDLDSTPGQTATTDSASTTGQTATTDSDSTTGQTSTTDLVSTPGQTATTDSASTTGQTATTDSDSTTGQTATSDTGSTAEQISTSNLVSTTDRKTTSDSTTEQITSDPTGSTAITNVATEFTTSNASSTESSNSITPVISTTPSTTDTQAGTQHSHTNIPPTTTAPNSEVLRDSRSIDSIATGQQVSTNTSIPRNISDDSDTCCSRERMVLDDELILDHSGSPEEYSSLEEDIDYSSGSEELKAHSLKVVGSVNSTSPSPLIFNDNLKTRNATENSKPSANFLIQDFEVTTEKIVHTHNTTKITQNVPNAKILHTHNTTERTKNEPKKIQSTMTTEKEDKDINERQVLSDEIIINRNLSHKTINNTAISSTARITIKDEANTSESSPLHLENDDSVEEYDSAETDEDTTTNNNLDTSTTIPNVESTETTNIKGKDHISSTIKTNMSSDNSNEKAVLSDEIILSSITPVSNLHKDTTNALEKQNPSTTQSPSSSTEDYDTEEYADEEESTETSQNLESSTATSLDLESSNKLERNKNVITPRPFQDKDTLKDQDNIMVLTKHPNPILKEALDINTEILANVREVAANTTVEKTTQENVLEDEINERKVLSDEIVINTTTPPSEKQNLTISTISTTETSDLKKSIAENLETLTQESEVPGINKNSNSSSEVSTSFEYDTEEVDIDEEESQEKKVLSDEVILNTAIPLPKTTPPTITSSKVVKTTEASINLVVNHIASDNDKISNTTDESNTLSTSSNTTEDPETSNSLLNTTEDSDSLSSSYEEVDDDDDDNGEEESATDFNERQVLSDEIIISSTSVPSTQQITTQKTVLSDSSSLIIETTTQQTTLATFTTQNILDQGTNEENESHERLILSDESVITTPRSIPENFLQETQKHSSTHESIANTNTHLQTNNTVTQINVHMRESENKSDTNIRPVNNTNIIIGGGMCIESPNIPTLNLTIYGDLNLHIRFCPRPCNETHVHNYEKKPILDAVWDSNASNKTMNLQAIS